MADALDDPLVGKVLSGRFQIMAPLGKGGMGRVYKALQTPLDRIVALKVLNPKYDSSKDPGFERRFFLEASMTAKLKHPNTITVHDYGRTDDGIFFIAMEYVEGQTLQQVLKQERRLPWPRAVAVAAQIARSLREAHKLGLVHRDLKPANVMVLDEGTGGDTVKVLDFGLVKAFSEEERKPADAEITQAGVLLGSPLYMAPEQAKSEADPRTDIYALGVVLFQMLAGRPPFEGKESIDIIVKHIREPPPSVRALAPETPLEIEAIVLRCLEKDPQHRYQSMDEVLEAFREATHGQGISGLFMDPRLSGTATPRVTGSAVPKVATSQPGLRGEGSGGVTKADRLSSIEVVLDSRATAPQSRSAWPYVVVGFLAVLCLTLAGLVLLRRAQHVERPPEGLEPTPQTTPTQPLPTPPEPTPTPAPTPAPTPSPPPQVTFQVESDPPGATVTRAGAVVGLTPVLVTLPLDGAAKVQATFDLALDGYQPVTVTGEGESGTVSLKQALKKLGARPQPLPSKKPPKQDSPAGYKDDPY